MDNSVFLRPGVPIEVPTEKGEFTVVLTKYGSRDIKPPVGYELPEELNKIWLTLSDAITAIREWENKRELLVKKPFEGKLTIENMSEYEHIGLANACVNLESKIAELINNYSFKEKKTATKLIQLISTFKSKMDDIYFIDKDSGVSKSPYYPVIRNAPEGASS